MAKLSEEKIQEIRSQYQIIGTYSGTAKVVGCSAATVKKYVEQEQAIVAPAPAPVKKPVTEWKGFIPPIVKIEVPDDLSIWFKLTDEEISNVERLREEF